MTALARKSFARPDFRPPVPRCNSRRYVTSRSYGRCCLQSGVSFFENMYDSGVAAMALGASRDEAFAPLLHARALARTLRVCEPGLVRKQFATFQLRFWNTPRQQTMGRRQSKWIDFIAFPRSYEILYEIYHTMLMERIRIRRSPTYPSSAAMGRLFYKVRWQRQSAVLKPINNDRGLHSLLPRASRMLKLDTAMRSASFPDFNSTVRWTAGAKRVYERSSRRYKYVDGNMCQANVRPKYFPFVTSTTVYNRFETCCAHECNYLVKYGKIFGASRSNCCTGCNRFRCQSNTRVVVHSLARDSTITSPGKVASGPVMVSMVV